MLIIALGLALIGLVALVFAVVTSNELVAWACIVACVIGIVSLIIDALRERRMRAASRDDEDEADQGLDEDEEGYVDYPEEAADEGDGETESSEEAATDATEESAVHGEDRAK